LLACCSAGGTEAATEAVPVEEPTPDDVQLEEPKPAESKKQQI